MLPVCKKYPDLSGDNGPGRSRSDFATKIHLVTDGSGLPVNILFSPGQAHKSQFAQRLLDGIGVQRLSGSMRRRGYAVQADKSYSGHALRRELKRIGIKAVISYKSNEKMAADGRSPLNRKTCHIATCYDKTVRNYLATVKLGCIR